MRPQYEKDYYGWILSTIELLKNKKYDEIDIQHLIEEVEDMGKSEKREIVSRLSQLIGHLLKWQHQPGLRSNSWKFTIKGQRVHINKLLIENPSFKSMIKEFITDGYELGTYIFKSETSLEIELPKNCPYSFDQLINNDFFPE